MRLSGLGFREIAPGAGVGVAKTVIGSEPVMPAPPVTMTFPLPTENGGASVSVLPAIPLVPPRMPGRLEIDHGPVQFSCVIATLIAVAEGFGSMTDDGANEIAPGAGVAVGAAVATPTDMEPV
jgi:hypothetical protein